jgi:hypothetical protein
MEERDLQKYILEQAKIEVEQSRSWPTKIMAFYIAINFGLVGSLIALQKGSASFVLTCWERVGLIVLILCLSYCVVRVLSKNHINYLTYRNIQIKFQQDHLKKLKEEYGLPDDWFKPNEVRLLTRFLGWGLYLYIVLMVTVLVVLGILFIL